LKKEAYPDHFSTLSLPSSTLSLNGKSASLNQNNCGLGQSGNKIPILHTKTATTEQEKDQ